LSSAQSPTLRKFFEKFQQRHSPLSVASNIDFQVGRRLQKSIRSCIVLRKADQEQNLSRVSDEKTTCCKSADPGDDGDMLFDYIDHIPASGSLSAAHDTGVMMIDDEATRLQRANNNHDNGEKKYTTRVMETNADYDYEILDLHGNQIEALNSDVDDDENLLLTWENVGWRREHRETSEDVEDEMLSIYDERSSDRSSSILLLYDP
jgi:hypothetical protein